MRILSRRNEASSNKKLQKITQSWSNQFWNPITNASVRLQYEKTSAQNRDPQMKKTNSHKQRNYIHEYNEVKEKLYTNSSFYV